MKKYFLSILILFTLSFSDVIAPENGTTLNTTHILFEWEQVPDAISYCITWIYGNNPEMLLGEEYTESLIYINTEIFDWETSYVWHVQPIFSDGSTGSYITNTDGTDHLNHFDIATSRSNAYAIEHNPNEYSDGITMFSSFFDYYSAAIDENGNEIWNSGDENIIFYNTDYFGQLFGAKLDNSSENYLPVTEYNLHNQILWQELAEHFSHHDMLQLSNGNYLSIVEDIEDGPIPPDIPEAFLFQLLGYQVDGITNEFPWVGDRIVEWDKDTKQEVWSWSTHDYFSKSDYDNIGSTWNAAFDGGRFDWTHANALAYSEEENTIYFSSRHLSRITKIDRNTGNIIWNLGMDMPSGDVHCGHNIGNSFQHSLQILDNGNIITLDNGNLSQQINNASYPTSRALEIEIEETDNGCNASVVWSYDLPEELFGFASGNVQKLNNGNYLATTVGNGGTSLEITPNNEMVWEGKYNLSLPNGAVYRANRISSLYPVAFSIIILDLTEILGPDTYSIEYADGYIDLIIYNDGSNDEMFCVEEINPCYNIMAFSNYLISIPISSENISINIYPLHRIDLLKSINIYINNFSETDCLNNFGDINSDNVVNVIDIIALVNIVVGGYQPNETQLCLADSNSDGILNVIDIIAIVNIIIG